MCDVRYEHVVYRDCNGFHRIRLSMSAVEFKFKISTPQKRTSIEFRLSFDAVLHIAEIRPEKKVFPFERF